MNDWRKALLGTLNFKPTPQNLTFLDTWQRWEGGHTNNTARFNWLNTTRGDGPAINSVGVKRFSSFQQGIQSTAETLMNGRYQDILDGLASGDPYSKDVAAGLQVWVSGRPDGNPKYAQKVLGQAAATPLPRRAAAAARKVKRDIQVAAANPDTNWDKTLRLIFDDDPEMAEILAGMDDQIAQSSGFVAPRGSVQPVDLGDDAPPVANRLAKAAGSQIGKPYVFGSGPGTDSFDCSDLIQWAYKQIGVNISRTTFTQIKEGRSVKGKPLQVGDLVFPNRGHVVMYVGNGKVIAAPYTGTVVQYQPLSRFRNIVDVRRVL
jgi:cell wall-associated NlpC family hydrolase